MHRTSIMPIVNVLSHIVCISITFWAMQSVRTDKWIKRHHVEQARIAIICISVAIGYLVSSFMMDIIMFSEAIQYLTAG